MIDEQGGLSIKGSIPTPESVAASGERAQDAIQEWLRQFAPAGRQDPRDEMITQLADSLRKSQVQTVGSQFGPIFLVSSRLDSPVSAVADRDIGSEPSSSSNVAAEYPLDAHLRDVERWARALLGRLGMDDSLCASVATAALVHDMGKADARFQTYLREGELAPSGDPLLAKSDMSAHDRARNRRARDLAWAAKGARHGLASVALAQRHAAKQRQIPS